MKFEKCFLFTLLCIPILVILWCLWMNFAKLKPGLKITAEYATPISYCYTSGDEHVSGNVNDLSNTLTGTARMRESRSFAV